MSEIRASLAETKLFHTLNNLVKELSSEVFLRFEKDGMHTETIDPANVCYVEYHLDAAAFVEYLVPEPVRVPVNLNDIAAVLRRVQPSDFILFNTTQNPSRFTISLRGDRNTEYSLPQTDIEGGTDIKSVGGHTCTVKLSSTIFSRAIEDMDAISESVRLTTKTPTEPLSVSGKSDIASATTTFPQGTVTAQVAKAATSKYSVEYLKKVIGGSKLARYCVLEYADDYPLRVTYQIVDKARITYLLAPRTDSG